MTDILRGQNLTVIRGRNKLIANVSCTIARGKITLVLGHNGAGKTVLLRVLHGLMATDEGSVEGPSLEQQKMVFQRPILLRRTARQHFEFVCPGLDEASVHNWFERSGLTDQMHQNCHALSGGEQQKLAVIGALASNPDLLFLDEATAHLDFESTQMIEQMVLEARSNDTTIVMISHNRAQAARLAEHVLFMDGGRLVESASANAFFTAPEHPAAQNFLAHH